MLTPRALRSAGDERRSRPAPASRSCSVLGFRRGRPAHHDDLDAKRARRLDLGVGRRRRRCSWSPASRCRSRCISARSSASANGPALEDELAVGQGVDLRRPVDRRARGSDAAALARRRRAAAGPGQEDRSAAASPSAATASSHRRDLDPAVAGLARPGRAGEDDRAACRSRGRPRRRWRDIRAANGCVASIDGVDALAGADRRPGPRRRRSRRCADGSAAAPGWRSRPASDRIGAMSGWSASRRASALASDVPPRMSRRRRFSGRELPSEQRPRATLASPRRHRRGRARRPRSCRAAARRASRPCRRRRAPSRACAPLKAETLTWPSPIENALDAIEARRGPARLRARQRRSVLLRRRRHAHAPLSRADEMISIPAPSAFASPPRGSAGACRIARLLTLHGRPLEAIIPHLQPGARILALVLGRARRRPSSRRFWPRAAWADRGSPSARRWAARASGSRTTAAQGFALDDVAAQHDRARGRRRPGARILPRAAGPARRLVRA